MKTASSAASWSTIQPQDVHKSPVALLCLSEYWRGLEEQTFRLASQLRDDGHPLTLLVRAGSPLQQQAQAHGLPSLALPAGTGRTVLQLSAWLRREKVGLLLTTHPMDLGIATLLKLAGPPLRWVHHQAEPLPVRSPRHGRWLTWQLRFVDAWLAPTMAQAHYLRRQHAFDLRRIWVVAPALPPGLGCAETSCSPPTARRLLDLPQTVPLVGVLDRGGEGAAFAVEALYHLRQEYGSAAELVVVGGPDSPDCPARWDRMRKVALQLHVEQFVHLRPLHNGYASALFFRAATALLLPAPADATDLPLLHALASGCPVVSCASTETGTSATQQLAGQFPVHDVVACVRGLARVLGDATAPDRAQQVAAGIWRQHNAAEHAQQVGAILEYVSH
ncbi:glycosyltransferase family 4 protein [Hymenobacter convexus]|uniref:glycosyltransferase family 4 protein n=1 Tax=Hymenobacter sp. CA1UV-4 TaxID=3063782 RepID=UPI0027131716|nr:glycosyltransferase family 4 protein [Hymenobacter sp. CA1UV-4]MDO7854067.1 glycosyltransferase family 4 protein [Hymenobacter sp. CA1UV-4]